jgi:hypothetical protein
VTAADDLRRAVRLARWRPRTALRRLRVPAQGRMAGVAELSLAPGLAGRRMTAAGSRVPRDKRRPFLPRAPAAPGRSLSRDLDSEAPWLTRPGRRGAYAAPGTAGGGGSVPAHDLRRAVRLARWRPRTALRPLWAGSGRRGGGSSVPEADDLSAILARPPSTSDLAEPPPVRGAGPARAHGGGPNGVRRGAGA